MNQSGIFFFFSEAESEWATENKFIYLFNLYYQELRSGGDGERIVEDKEETSARQKWESIDMFGESQVYQVGCHADYIWGERTETNKMWGPVLDSLEWLHRNVSA